jgi:three-Cys-motif partner protein
MNKQKESWLKAYHYVDAFAGSGKPKAKDQERYIAGSPLRALQCQPPFDRYWFIELSSIRVSQLRSLKNQFKHLDIKIRKGDCNEILCNRVVPKITYKSNQRGLVFLDPYGLEVEWETIKGLARAKTFDVFVNFPLGGVTRLLKRDEPPKGGTKALLNKVIGSTDWVDALYKPSPQLSLFGEENIGRDVVRAEWLASLYSARVSQLFNYVSKPVIMRNSKKAPLYALFLASHKEAAVGIINDVFGKFEQVRELR